MRRRLLTALLLATSLWGHGAGAADGPYPAATLETAKALQSQALAGQGGGFGFVESLTTRVGPRLAGSAANRAAEQWAMDQFRSLGLANIKAEEFSLDGWERGIETAMVTTPSRQPLHVTALGHSIATPQQGVEGEIVRFATLEDLQNAADGSLKGKIAFIDTLMPRLQDGAGYGQAVGARGKGPEAAARKGAAALLIRSVGTDSHRFPHTGITAYAKDVNAIPAAALSNPDADQLGRLLALGQPVRVRLTLASQPMGKLNAANVMAEIRGSELPEEVVVIGAHLDSWDLGTGAVDDGAGVGIVLATARLLKALPQPPKRTVRFVLFGAEEIGLVGAKAYAAAHAAEIPRHLVGTEADLGAGPVISFGTRFRPEAKPVADAMMKVLAPLGIVQNPTRVDGGPDMVPLAAAGMATAGLNLDATDYFDVHHTADDTLDKVDAGKLNQSTAAYASFIWLAAQSPMALGPVEKKKAE